MTNSRQSSARASDWSHRESLVLVQDLQTVPFNLDSSKIQVVYRSMRAKDEIFGISTATEQRAGKTDRETFPDRIM